MAIIAGSPIPAQSVQSPEACADSAAPAARAHPAAVEQSEKPTVWFAARQQVGGTEAAAARLRHRRRQPERHRRSIGSCRQRCIHPSSPHILSAAIYDWYYWEWFTQGSLALSIVPTSGRRSRCRYNPSFQLLKFWLLAGNFVRNR